MLYLPSTSSIFYIKRLSLFLRLRCLQDEPTTSFVVTTYSFEAAACHLFKESHLFLHSIYSLQV